MSEPGNAQWKNTWNSMVLRSNPRSESVLEKYECIPAHIIPSSIFLPANICPLPPSFPSAQFCSGFGFIAIPIWPISERPKSEDGLKQLGQDQVWCSDAENDLLGDAQIGNRRCQIGVSGNREWADKRGPKQSCPDRGFLE